MKPKEKAKELVDRYYFVDDYHSFSKQCALIAVDEIINLDYFSEEGREYWQEVKKEIEKL